MIEEDAKQTGTKLELKIFLLYLLVHKTVTLICDCPARLAITIDVLFGIESNRDMLCLSLTFCSNTLDYSQIYAFDDTATHSLAQLLPSLPRELSQHVIASHVTKVEEFLLSLCT